MTTPATNPKENTATYRFAASENSLHYYMAPQQRPTRSRPAPRLQAPNTKRRARRNTSV